MRKIFRKAFVILLVLSMLFSGVAAVSAGADDGSTLVPIRAFVEEAGGEVSWNSEDRSITIILEDNVYLLFVDSTVAFVNNSAVVLQYEVTILPDSRGYIAAVDLASILTPGYLSGTTGIAALASRQFMELVSIPGITVAIVDAEEGFTWTGGFGYADVAGGKAVDEFTLFNLASISKTFTATAVMQLAEAGVIRLDEPVVTYLPDFYSPTDLITGEGDYRNITVRMLLSHASGISPFSMGSGALTSGSYNPVHMNNFLEIISEFPMAAPEATFFSYANDAYTLLGILVAEMTGDDSYFEGYAKYMDENVFGPAGMELSTFIPESRHTPHLAQPYADAVTKEDWVFLNALPTGGLFSNAHDMARFMHIILNGGALDNEENRLLSQNSVNQMLQAQNFESVSAVSIIKPGMGFLHTEGMDGFRYIGHGGNVIHFHSSMVFDINSGLGVFVSVNSITGISIVEALAVLILQNAIVEKTGALNLPASNPDVTPIGLTSAQMAGIEGVYSIVGADNFARVAVSEDALYIEDLAGAPYPLELIPLSDGSFLNPEFGLRFWFEMIDDEVVMFLGEFKSQVAGARLDPDVVSADESFEQWVGTYMPVMAPGEVSLYSRVIVGIDENGFAVMQAFALHGLSPISPLIPLGGGVFVGGVEFVADGDGVWMEIAGLRLKRTG